MDTLRAPGPLNLEGNVSENWRRWIQQFKVYLCASEKDQKDEKLQCALLLHCAGEQAQELYNTFTFTQDEADKIESLIKKFEDYCTPKKNTTYERHVFNNRVQKPDETFDQFVTDLRILSRNCEYERLLDGIIRDRIIEGIRDNDTRRRLLREDKLTLERCVDICRAAECTQQQMKSFHNDPRELGESSETVNALTQSRSAARSGHAQRGRARYTPSREGQTVRPRRERKDESNAEREQLVDCRYCGQTHARRRCPAYGKSCSICKKPNHFARVCNSKRVEEIQENTDSDSEDELDLFAVTSSTEENAWHVELDIKSNKVKCKIDTAAQANVMPKKLARKIKKTYPFHIKQTKRRLTGYGGNKLPVAGKCTLPCTLKGKTHMCEFTIVDLPTAEPILGLKDCVNLDVVRLIRSVNKTDEKPIMEEYKDVFEGIGCLADPYHIQTKADVTPVVHAPRKIPVTLTNRLKEELQRMEKLKVITKVDGPTDWVNSMVIVEKPDSKLRICLDPKELNTAICRQHFQIPTIDEVMSKLAGAKHFTTLDASCGYWQIPLTAESSNLTTFNTPFGRYKYLRLPFGINSAQEVFHKRMTQLFENIEGVVTYIDDLLIFGRTKEEHDDRLRQVLDRAREVNLRFNKKKCKIGITEVKYLGHTLNQDGLKPDPTKVQAIAEMEKPEDRAALERFMGMVTFLAKFIPNLSATTEPLRELLQKDIAWHWMDKHEKAFNEIKKTITDRAQTSLRYYDVVQPVKLSVDASKAGLGAVLMQNGAAVAYASKALTKAQINYAQIEKETLAIVFGCQKFHQFIYGKQTEIETDHKPLVSIFKKPLGSTSPRIQRLLLKLQPYQLTVNHKPGKELYVADTLSRAFLKETDDEAEPNDRLEREVDAQVHLILKHMPVSVNGMEELRKETQRDDTLTALRTMVKQGWPDYRTAVPHKLKDFWNYREEICEMDGLMMKGDRIIVPQTMTKDMLKAIHAGHFGIEKCKLRARELLFWPRMTKDIERVVSKCNTCLTNRNSQQKETLVPHETPDRPWQILATDLFAWHGRDYLIIVDYYSRYWEVERLPDTKAATIIRLTKSILARHGIPDVIKSDNGPQYTQEYKRFSREWNFKHTTVSPRHPQSNGLVEKSVQTVKRIMDKAAMEGSDPYIGLLEYRNTPIGDCGSPAQMLMSRRLKALIPCTESQLIPKIHKSPQEIRDAIRAQKQKQKTFFDRTARDLPPLHEGDSVRVQDHATGRWSPAVVTDTAQTPRSYIIETAQGRQLRRNRKHLLATQAEPDRRPEGPEHIPIIATESPATVSPTTATDARKETDNQPIIQTVPQTTRSGRVVRPPPRYEE